MKTPGLGAVLYTYFEDNLIAQKGLSSATVRSYRDALQLFLRFVAAQRRCRLTRLRLSDLTAERVREFLNALEIERGNHIRSRNQRLIALRSFFDYLAFQVPDMWAQAEQVTRIPGKRVPPPRTFYLERDEIETLLVNIPVRGANALRDRALLLFLYNTGARVQEVADLQTVNLELDHRRVHLHGKGDKWRACPLWNQTVTSLKELLDQQRGGSKIRPVFLSQRKQALTRFGIYKIVRRHTRELNEQHKLPDQPSISPHTFRHSAAVSLLESGVEVNVIRAWLGHVSLETTNRYAEISISMKEKALQACELTQDVGKRPNDVIWRDDLALLNWLQSL